MNSRLHCCSFHIIEYLKPKNIVMFFRNTLWSKILLYILAAIHPSQNRPAQLNCKYLLMSLERVPPAQLALYFLHTQTFLTYSEFSLLSTRGCISNISCLPLPLLPSSWYSTIVIIWPGAGLPFCHFCSDGANFCRALTGCPRIKFTSCTQFYKEYKEQKII